MTVSSVSCATEIWLNAALDEARETQLIPHSTIDSFVTTQPCLFLVESSQVYPPYVIFLALNTTVVVYDGAHPSTFFILAPTSKKDSISDFLRDHTIPCRGLPVSFAEVFGSFTAQVKTHSQIIHYAPSLHEIGDKFEFAAPLFQRPLSYALIVSTPQNAELVPPLAKLRVGPFCSSHAHDPFLVLIPPIPRPSFPLSNNVVHGIILKLPETYAASPMAWDFMARPSFYVATQATMTMTGFVGIGQRHVVTSCTVPVFEDGPCVFKQHQLLRRRLLRGLDDLETQSVARCLLETLSSPYDVLPCRLFVETNVSFQETRILKLEDLLNMSVGRVGIVERKLEGLAKARANDFKELQHWVFVQTSRQVLLRRAKVAHDVKQRLVGRQGPVLTSIVLWHESLSKYFFTGTNPGKPALDYFANEHVCTGRCNQLPL